MRRTTISGTKDGSNTSFTLDTVPPASTPVFIVHGGMILSIIASAPGIGECTLSGAALVVGLAPASGDALYAFIQDVSAPGLKNIAVSGIQDGSNTSFTLAETPAVGSSVILTFSGIVQTEVAPTAQPGEFSISGTTITLGLAPTGVDTLDVWVEETTTVTFAAGGVTGAQDGSNTTFVPSLTSSRTGYIPSFLILQAGRFLHQDSAPGIGEYSLSADGSLITVGLAPNAGEQFIVYQIGEIAIPAATFTAILDEVKVLIRYEPMNLALNPGFETGDFTGWITFGSLSGGDALTVDSSVKQAGSYSFKVVCASGTTIGKLQAISVLPGQTYTLSGYINVSAYTAGTVNLDVQGTGIDLAGILPVATTSGFVLFTETFTVPTGTTSVNLRIFGDASPVFTAYFDNIVLERADVETLITDVYQRELEALCQQHDWWAEQEDISVVADQSIYEMQENAIRPIGIVHNKVMLEKITAWAIDQQSASWQADVSGTPNYWFFDQIPAALDGLASVASNKLAVHPPPDTSRSGDTGLHIFETAVPESFGARFLWANRCLALRVAAEVIRQGETDRRLDLESDNLTLAGFYEQVAALWFEVLGDLIPR